VFVSGEPDAVTIIPFVKDGFNDAGENFTHTGSIVGWLQKSNDNTFF
jgi:hypothetical protein